MSDNICFCVCLESSLSSMFGTKCYRQNDRIDNGIISRLRIKHICSLNKKTLLQKNQGGFSTCLVAVYLICFIINEKYRHVCLGFICSSPPGWVYGQIYQVGRPPGRLIWGGLGGRSPTRKYEYYIFGMLIALRLCFSGLWDTQ